MDQTKTTRRQAAFLQRLADAKDRLLNSIAGLDPAILCTEPVAGEWTVKDIFGHVVSWNEEFRDDIRIIQQGKHPGYERHISGEDDFDRWNRRQIARKSAWTWQQILEDFDRDYQEAVQLILRLEPKDFRKRGVTPWKQAALDKPSAPTNADTESIETLANYHWRHMNEHAGRIERWREQRGHEHKSSKPCGTSGRHMYISQA